MSEFSPREHGLAAIWVAFWWVVGVLLVAGTILFFTWIKPTFIDQDNENFNHSRGHQDVLVSNVTKNLALVDQITVQLGSAEGDQVAALKAQRAHTVDMVCNDGAKVTEASELSTDQAQFLAANCTDGHISTDSQYYVK